MKNKLKTKVKINKGKEDYLEEDHMKFIKNSSNLVSREYYNLSLTRKQRKEKIKWV